MGSKIKDIGELNRRITILVFEEQSDNLFGYQETWTEWGTVWAKVEPSPARAQTMVKEAAQVTSGVGFFATIRYHDDLYTLWSRLGAQTLTKPGTDTSIYNAEPSRMRVKYDDRIFDVKALVDPDGGYMWIEIWLSETWRTA